MDMLLDRSSLGPDGALVGSVGLAAHRGTAAERPAAAPRNGEVLPIGAILPEVLRRYDLALSPEQTADPS